MQTRKVAVIVGSLRKESLTRKLAKAIAALSPEHLTFHFVEIGDMPLYNEDLETDTPPASWVRFREEIAASDAVLFVTPEYNRTIPGALKNAIDVGSRPYGQSHFNGKPTAIVSASPGAIGGFGANHQLRQALVFLDMPVLQQPEAYLSGLHQMFDDEGNIENEGTRDFVATIAARFAAWIEKVRD